MVEGLLSMEPTPSSLQVKQSKAFQNQSLHSAELASVSAISSGRLPQKTIAAHVGSQPFTFNVLLKKRNKIGDIPLPLLQSDCLAPNISSLQKMSHIVEM